MRFKRTRFGEVMHVFCLFVGEKTVKDFGIFCLIHPVNQRGILQLFLFFEIVFCE